jgi:hypothetical protein
MGMQQRHRRGQSDVGDAKHADLAVAGEVLHQPLDAVVGVGGLVGRGGVRQVHRRAQLENALRLESAAQILNHEDVPVLGQLLDGRRHLGERCVGHAIRCPAEHDRQGTGLIGRGQDRGLQPRAVAHGDHHLLEGEGRLGRRLLGRGAGRECQGSETAETAAHSDSLGLVRTKQQRTTETRKTRRLQGNYNGSWVAGWSIQ